jgi:hypothetical protein
MGFPDGTTGPGPRLPVAGGAHFPCGAQQHGGAPAALGRNCGHARNTAASLDNQCVMDAMAERFLRDRRRFLRALESRGRYSEHSSLEHQIGCYSEHSSLEHQSLVNAIANTLLESIRVS